MYSVYSVLLFAFKVNLISGDQDIKSKFIEKCINFILVDCWVKLWMREIIQIISWQSLTRITSLLHLLLASVNFVMSQRIAGGDDKYWGSGTFLKLANSWAYRHDLSNNYFRIAANVSQIGWWHSFRLFCVNDLHN